MMGFVLLFMGNFIFRALKTEATLHPLCPHEP